MFRGKHVPEEGGWDVDAADGDSGFAGGWGGWGGLFSVGAP